MAEFLIGAAALTVVALVVWIVARLALIPFLRVRSTDDGEKDAADQ